MNLAEELKWRGFVNQTTFKDVDVLNGEPLTFYWGVDPSAPSMTIGNLAAAMMARHFISHGHKAILLIGGATGLIGDPDGKNDERALKPIAEVESNKNAIVEQYKTIFNGLEFRIVDNYDWFKDINYLDFLRNVGKNVPMRQMLSRDFVSNRLSEKGSGISYAEFSYVLIQAYDFLHLNQEYGVTLQLCGSDQWGNSIAGVDLIRRVTGNETHVWSTPLVLNKSTGTKFGKTEAGAIWLDENQTSAFKFYQFWLNTDDEGAQDYLKIYTTLDKAEIVELIAESKTNPASRVAQKRLAYEVTKIVHGQTRADSVVKASEVLFGQRNFSEISNEELAILENELPVIQFDENISNIITTAGLASSNSESIRFINSGAVYVNGQKLTQENTELFKTGKNLIKLGKNKFAIVEKS